MCTHSRYITNRYTHKRVLVSCGHCEACIQERAARRATRIRNHAKDGYLCLFVTLTYSPDFLPFVYKDDLKVTDDYINIYRAADIRHYRKKDVKSIGVRPIDSVFLGDDALLSSYGVKSPVGSPADRVSVIYYKDVQNFFKRLRINLNRDYGITEYISYFSCSEYGPRSHRAHHHLLIWCRYGDEEKVRSSIVKSWSYADKARTKEYIEIARDAASYVASYVNGGTSLPEILTSSAFRQKHSSSLNFGKGLSCFSLDSVLSKFRQGTFDYNVTKIEQGILSVVSVPIPRYVIDRFFPRCRGSFSLSPLEVRSLLCRPSELGARITKNSNGYVTWSSDDVRLWSVRLLNIWTNYFKSIFSTFDLFCEGYPSLYCDVLNRYNSYLLGLTLTEVLPVVGIENYYENVADAVLPRQYVSPSTGEIRYFPPKICSDLDLSKDYVLDPNKRSDVVEKTTKFRVLFHKMDKSRKITNVSLMHQNIYV